MAKKKKVESTHIPNAELDVLACLWQEGPVTARRIREKMLKYRPMAHGSVVTLLTRLEAKNLATKVKGPVGKAFLFSPGKKAEITQRELVADMVDRVFNGDHGAMQSALNAVKKGGKK